MKPGLILIGLAATQIAALNLLDHWMATTPGGEWVFAALNAGYLVTLGIFVQRWWRSLPEGDG